MRKQQTAAPRGQEQAATEQQAQAHTAQASAAQIPPMHLDVRVRPIQPKGNLLAFASMNINGCFAVEGIKVVTGEKGLFINMPSYKDGQGQWRDICFPIDKDFRKQISDAVLGEYQHVMTQMQAAAQAQKQCAPEMEAPAPAMTMSM